MERVFSDSRGGIHRGHGRQSSRRTITRQKNISERLRGAGVPCAVLPRRYAGRWSLKEVGVVQVMPAVVIFGCGAVGLAFAAYLFYTVSLISLDSEEVAIIYHPAAEVQISFCGGRGFYQRVSDVDTLQYTCWWLKKAACSHPSHPEG